MNPVAVLAAGALSPLGRGDAATAPGPSGERPRSFVQHDPDLARAGLRRPRAARAPVGLVERGPERAHALLETVARDLVERLERAMPAWRERRVALVVGTSAGGLSSLEPALRQLASGEELASERARAAFYDAPLARIAPLFGKPVRIVSLLGACTASTLALGLGCRLLEAGEAELVIAGGYDALTDFLATGFEALGATTESEPLPFRAARDGMALGEGAALLALVRAGAVAPHAARGFILGFGATSDATHVTAPDPTGRGLARAARAALLDAAIGPDAVELVSAHATATRHNDSAEAAALALTFGPALANVVIHPFKAVVGHTLGAAGALETLAGLDALAAGALPAAGGDGAVDPGFAGRLLSVNEPGAPRVCLKLSAAFGGSNAALVLGAAAEPAGTSTSRAARAAPARRSVASLFEGALVTEPDFDLIARRTRLDEVRRARLERASALAVTAVAAALEAVGPFDPETTGVVVGTVAASLEADELFDARRRERGVAGVEPRRFPATSPNLPAGACSIAFGLRGPAFAVGGGPTSAAEAFAVAENLVAAGDAERVLVVVCNDVGPVTRALCRSAGFPLPEDGARVRVVGVAAR
nr:hypothetical protein Hi04_10k_c3120_00020 [uncultured bacterium]